MNKKALNKLEKMAKELKSSSYSETSTNVSGIITAQQQPQVDTNMSQLEYELYVDDPEYDLELMFKDESEDEEE